MQKSVGWANPPQYVCSKMTGRWLMHGKCMGRPHSSRIWHQSTLRCRYRRKYMLVAKLEWGCKAHHAASHKTASSCSRPNKAKALCEHGTEGIHFCEDVNWNTLLQFCWWKCKEKVGIFEEILSGFFCFRRWQVVWQGMQACCEINLKVKLSYLKLCLIASMLDTSWKGKVWYGCIAALRCCASCCQEDVSVFGLKYFIVCITVMPRTCCCRHRVWWVVFCEELQRNKICLSWMNLIN